MSVPAFDLSLLIPEILIVSFMAFLTIVEMCLPEISQRFSTWMNLAGTFLVGIGLLSVSGLAGVTFQGMFILDSLAIFFKFLFLLTAVCIFIMRGQSKIAGEFPLLLWSALLGMFFLVSSYDFLLFFISIELLTLSLYILTAYTRTDRLAVEAGLKYLVMGSLAAAFLLYGISLIYAASGTLSFEILSNMTFAGEKDSWLFWTGVLFVLSALGFKVAAVPFHVWVPDVYQGAPTPTVAFLSVASKSAGFAALLRILFEAIGGFAQERHVLFSLLASMTLFYGNLGALVQKDMKRLLGFSSIGHAGFLLAALAGQENLVGTPILYYLIAYGVTNLTAFLVVSIVDGLGKSQSLDSYKGLSQRSPLLAGGMFLAMLSLAGVPPLAGFFSKFFILLSIARSEIYWLVFLGSVNVAISLYYYLSVVRLVYFERPEDSSPIPLNLSSKFLLIVLMAAIVIVGIWQAPFFQAASWGSKGI